MKNTFHFLCIIFGILIFSAPPPLLAASFSYKVELSAPDIVSKLLKDNLRIIELQKNKEMDTFQLKSVYKNTSQEIQDLLATDGYFNSKVTSSLDQNQNEWVAKFDVITGPIAIVKNIAINFAGEITNDSEENYLLRNKVRDSLPIKEHDSFVQASWTSAKREALQSLLAERYPAAHVAKSEARVDVDGNIVNLSITLDSGPAFKFGAVEISGLQRYGENIVKRHNPINTGSPYSLEKVQEFQQRLQDTGYFSSVLISIDTETPTPDNAILRINVVERRPRKAGFGIGYSTDTKNRFSIEYEDVNLFSRALRLKSALKLETLQQEFTGEVAFPRTGGGFDRKAFTSYQHQNIQNEEDRKFSYGGAITRVNGNVEKTISLQHVYENQVLQGAEGSIRQAIFGNFSWTQRAVDSLFFPRKGYLLSLQLGAAPRVLPKSESFIRSYGRGVYYLPIGDNDSMIFRTELGYVAAKSSDTIPSDFLFRTGGDTSVRGYAYQGIGVQKGEAIVGGRVLGVASAEYIHWINNQWGAAIFYDTGDATDRLTDFKFNAGYGIGTRWRSPVGPLNVDVAYGQENKEVRLHFTLGVAF